MNMTIEEKAQEILKLNNNPTQNAIGILQSGEKRKLRIFKSSVGTYCYKAPRKQRYGYRLSTLQLQDLLPIESVYTKPVDQIWYDSWIKVRNKLHASELWTEILNDVRIALLVGYEKVNEAYKQSWLDDTTLTYEQNKADQAKRVAEIDKRLVDMKDGTIAGINTSILWYMTKPAKVKKMRFRTDSFNADILKRIASAMQDKKSCNESGRTNYDVSFEYSAEKNTAWYSEEFKGCGNGHYYLALDASHALFYEDD